ANGRINPDTMRGLDVIREGRAVEVGREVLKRPPQDGENGVPIWRELRRAVSAYYQNDAEGMLENSILALGQYSMLRGDSGQRRGSLGEFAQEVKKKGGQLPTPVDYCAPNPKNAASGRRAYLNAKFGRSGNLDSDINARGIDNAIRANAQRAADFARRDRGLGNIRNNPQAFGTRAHDYFERFNNRLSNRVAGT